MTAPRADADEARSSPAESVDRQALLTALTTEHFYLQGAKGSALSESTSRASLFIGALSSTLIAIGFLGQAARFGTAFDVFVLAVLPTLYTLGLFTFVRTVASSIEDLRYGLAINRIRAYYVQLAGAEARFFALSAYDDLPGVLDNLAISRASRWQLYFTLASMVSILTALIGGATVAFLAGVAGAPLGAAIPAGILAAVTSVLVSERWQRRAHEHAHKRAEVLFPSPP